METYDEVLKRIERKEWRAKTELAWYMLTGVGGAEKDEGAALDLLYERVREGDGKAMWMLGICMLFGIGTKKNVEEAERLFKRSQRKNNDVGAFLVRRKIGSGLLRSKGL